MSRFSRVLCTSGIYHVMLRGNERKEIFIDDEDKQRFIDTLIEKTHMENAHIHSYCLMDNHVHLLIGNLSDNLGKLMKRITVSYVNYFNRKYKRIGHLFHDRFRSENIENENYLLEAVRYIHNNPVKACMVKRPKDYKWSSFHHYLNGNIPISLDTQTVLEIFSETHTVAVECFLEFSNKFGEYEFIDYNEKTVEEQRQISENDARNSFLTNLDSRNILPDDLKIKDNAALRNEIICDLKSQFRLSILQLERITGINRGTILRLYQKNGVGKNRL